MINQPSKLDDFDSTRYLLTHMPKSKFFEGAVEDSGIALILPNLGILFGMGLVLSGVSVWGFKRGKVFE
jgi:hypothetical protein